VISRSTNNSNQNDAEYVLQGNCAAWMEPLLVLKNQLFSSSKDFFVCLFVLNVEVRSMSASVEES